MGTVRSNNDVQKLMDSISSQKALVAARLLLNGLWHNEIHTLIIEDFDGRILDIKGRRRRKVIVDPTTSQLIKFLTKGQRKDDKIIDLSGNRISVILSEVCCKKQIHMSQPTSELRNFFIATSIEKGRNSASVYAQVGMKNRLLKGVKIPTIEDRMEDFDSKPII